MRSSWSPSAAAAPAADEEGAEVDAEEEEDVRLVSSSDTGAGRKAVASGGAVLQLSQVAACRRRDHVIVRKVSRVYS